MNDVRLFMLSLVRLTRSIRESYWYGDGADVESADHKLLHSGKTEESAVGLLFRMAVWFDFMHVGF